MAEYRVYCMNAEGHITSAESIEAKDDGEALILAASIQGEGICELWQGARFIALLPALQPQT